MKDLEETIFTTGGLWGAVINSLAEIYKHFPRSVIFEDELRERFSEAESSSSDDIGRREDISDSGDQFRDDNAVPICSPTPRKQFRGQITTAKKLLSQEISEEATAELLHSYQETLNNLAQKTLIKDVRIDKFHGQDNEVISRDESTLK